MTSSTNYTYRGHACRGCESIPISIQSIVFNFFNFELLTALSARERHELKMKPQSHFILDSNGCNELTDSVEITFFSFHNNELNDSGTSVIQIGKKKLEA